MDAAVQNMFLAGGGFNGKYERGVIYALTGRGLG
jgi:hypothetical protein